MSTVTSAARAAPPLEGSAMKRVLTHRRVAVLVLAIVFCHDLAAPEDALAAPPSFVAAGTIASAAGGAITPGMPAGVLANDVLLLFLETADQAVTVSGGTETWAQVTNSPQSVAGATRLTVFWARASQDAPTSPTTAGPADHVIGRMIAVRGVITSGNPWDVTSGGTEAVSDTTGSITGATTTVIDTLVVAAMATDLPDGNGTANFSGWANASLASVAEVIDNTRNSGNGGGIGVATGTKAAIGAYGATTVTLASAAQKAFMTIALKPPATATTTLGDGIAGTNATVCPGAAAQKLDGFSFVNSSGNNPVTALTVTTTGFAAIASMQIWDEAGTTQYFGTVSNPGSNTWNFSGGTSIPVSTSAANFKVLATYYDHASAPAGNTVTTANVTAFTTVNTTGGTDSADTTLTLDNLTPATGASWGTNAAGDGQNTLNWTYGAGGTALIVRYTASTDTTFPVDGTTYVVGNSFGTGGTIRYVGSAANPQNWVDNVGIVNGTTYYYRIFDHDGCLNYVTTAPTAPWSGPLTPAATTTVGDGTNPSTVTIAPGGAAAMLDAFTIQASSGTNSVTAGTVSLAAGTAQRLALVEITDDAGGTVYGSAADPASDTVAITLTTNITATTTLTQYKVRITPKSHASMPAPPGAGYAVTGTVTAIACTNNKVYNDTASATVTIDNLSTANATWGTITTGVGQIDLNWANPGDADFSEVVILRNTASISDTPAEGATYVQGNTIGTSEVRYAGSLQTFLDTGLSNGQPYYYKVFAKDTSGNYATGAQTGPHTPGNSTTVGDGTNPSTVTICPGGAATMLDAFTLQTNGGNDTVTAATVSLSAGTAQRLSLVEITDDDGGTVYGSAADPASDTVAITLDTNITATTTLTQYKVRVTPKAQVSMPVPPGGSYAVIGTVTSITSTGGKTYDDTASATVTIDNASPSAGSFSACTGVSSSQINLGWTNPGTNVLVVRGPAGGTCPVFSPTEGFSYSTGAQGVDQIVYAGSATSFSDTGLSGATSYCYEIWSRDDCYNYAASPPGATNCSTTAPTTITVGDGTNPGNANLCPGGAATMLDAFTLQTSSGSDSATSVTVSLNAGSASGLSLVEITNDAGTMVYGSTSNPASDTVVVSTPTGIPATTTQTQFKVRVTPRPHASMPAPYGAAYAVTGVVTGLATASAKVFSDAASATVAIDNRSTADAAWGAITPASGQITLGWTNPTDADFGGVIILRNSTGNTDVPAEGTTYAQGNTIGGSTVRYVGSGTSFIDNSGIVNGTPYYYTIYARDTTCVNYSIGVETGPHTFANPVVPGLPSGSAASCTQVDVSVPFSGDSNGTSTTKVEYGTSASGPWTVSCAALSGASPRSCPVSGLVNNTPYWFQVTFTDADGVSGTNPQITGPDTTLDCRVATQTPSAVVDNCVKITVSAPLTGDADGDSTVTVGRGASGGGPFTDVAGCVGLGASNGSPRTCVDTTVSAGQTYYYQVTFADADGITGSNPQVIGPFSTPSTCGTTAGTATAVVSGCRQINVSAPFTGDSDADGSTLVEYRTPPGSGAYNTACAAATGASPRACLVTGLAASTSYDVRVTYADPDTVSGTNPQTITPVTTPSCAGNGAPPMVLFVSPARSAVVGGTERFKVQVYDPDDVPSAGVLWGLDGGALSGTVTKNTTYNCNTGSQTTCAVFEFDVDTTALANGAHFVTVQATDTVSDASRASLAFTVNNSGAAAAGSGTLLRRAPSSQLCADCHNVATHSSQSASFNYGAWAMDCITCHTPHQTKNIYLVRPQISTPNSGVKTVDFRAVESGGTSVGPNMLATLQASGNGVEICEVCHTKTKHADATPRARNSAATDWTKHTTAKCTTCHSHTGGFGAGESGGNTPCSSCHNYGMLVSEGTRTNTYHHVMETDVVIGGGLTAYPTAATPTQGTGDNDKTCVQCHADHNVFRDAANTLGRGANLRSRIGTGPVAGQPPNDTSGYYTNTDQNASYAAGGICLSCHAGAQTKNTADQKSDGSTETMALNAADFSASAHAYGAEGSITTGNSTFTVPCTKCHSSDTSTSYQNGTYKFTLHASPDRRLRNPMGMTSPTDPLEEKFCWRCHSLTTNYKPGGGPAKTTANRDYFNAADMSAGSQNMFNLLGRRPAPDAYLLASGTYAGNTTTFARRTLSTSAGSTEEARTQATVTGSNYYRIAQFVSPPVTAGFTWASGSSFTLNVRYAESATSVNAFLRYALYQWNAADSQGTNFRAVAQFGTEMPTSAGNVAIALTSSSAVTFAAGDKIVLEIEFFTNSATAAGTVSNYWGNATSNAGLVLPNSQSFNDNGSTTSTNTLYMRSGSFHAVDSYTGLHKPQDQEGLNAADGSLSGANRHVECEDCHNPHAAGSGNHSAGGNLVGNSAKGVWGVEPAYGAAWTQPTYARVNSSTKEYQICLKCHSAYAYGASQPNTPSGFWDNSGSSIDAPETDQGVEFNPANYAHHPIYGQGKNQPGAANPNFANTFVSPWGPSSTMTCSDCHGRSVTTDPLGPHGSAEKYILRKNETGSGTANVFCYNCHRRDVYGDDGYTPPNASYSRVSHPMNTNHDDPAKAPRWGIWCMNCHGGDSLGGMHGSNRGVGSFGTSAIGKRLLNGASITGMTRATTTTNSGGCWTKGATDAVEICAQSHGNKTWTANYNYDAP